MLRSQLTHGGHMKETIDTIPIMDAMNANDECPFCYIERQLEQHAISFILGSAYMEDDVRMETDRIGFCRQHYHKMFAYGNRLGSALILSTHIRKLKEELKEELHAFNPEKNSILKRLRKSVSQTQGQHASLSSWIYNKEKSCYVCQHIQNNYQRYLDSFLELWNTNSEFMNSVKTSKGFCLHHFADLIDASERKLKNQQKQEFYTVIFQLMEENLQRLEEEVTWFTDKFDYRNKDKAWGNSQDSIQRCMQKAAGGYPADPPFQSER